MADVQHDERDREGIGQAADTSRIGDLDPGLELLEARPPVVVQGDDLTIEHVLLGPLGCRQRGQLGKGGGDVSVTWDITSGRPPST